MKKEIKYPLNGLALGALAGIFYSMLEQYLGLKEKGLPFWDNLDRQKLIKYGAIGGGLGLVAGYGYYKWEFYKESQKPFESNAYTKSVLREYSGQSNSGSVLGKKIRNEIKDFISETYDGRLAGKPLNWGSTARGTAINSNCDYDLLVPFSKRSFGTLEEMHSNLYDTLRQKYRGVNIRKQGRSIGLTFNTNTGEIHIDIVPGREIRNYSLNGKLNLYVKGGLLKVPSRIKTSVNSLREMTVNRPKEREVVKLMKVYRDRYGFNVNSTFLQHLVLEAFDKKTATFSTADNLMYVMAYLADKLTYARIVDRGNSNNVISGKVDDYSRNLMTNQLVSDLNKLDQNKHYLKQIFPI
ncbi:MAG: hypothetical protein HC831_03850 [Chloroflexia bacterium]|nr:hypothetical protein [Chloroflexia bacterium]